MKYYSLSPVLILFICALPYYALSQESADSDEEIVIEETAASQEKISDAGEEKSPVVGDEEDLLIVPYEEAAKEQPAGEEAVSEGKEKSVVTEEEDLLLIDEEEEDIFKLKEELSPASHDSAAEQKAAEASLSADTSGERIQREDTTGQMQRYRGRYRGRYQSEAPKNVPQPKEKTIAEPTAKPAQETVPLGPAKVLDVRSINFAKNLKDYRSPKKAMFLSLLLPGLGQAYTKRYVKSAIYGLVEAGIIYTSIKFAVDGRDEKSGAEKFADQNFDMDKFWGYYNNMKDFLETTHLEQYDTLINKFVTDVMQGICWDSTETAGDAAAKNDRYYDNLQWNSFVHGWNDCEPVFTKDGFVLDSASYTYSYNAYQESDTNWLLNRINKSGTPDTLTMIYGYSRNQGIYSDMLSKSNRKFSISRNILFVLLVNHLISSVDALVSAIRHNETLLEKESIWQHIELDNRVAFSGRDIVSHFGVRVRF